MPISALASGWSGFRRSLFFELRSGLLEIAVFHKQVAKRIVDTGQGRGELLDLLVLGNRLLIFIALLIGLREQLVRTRRVGIGGQQTVQNLE